MRLAGCLVLSTDANQIKFRVQIALSMDKESFFQPCMEYVPTCSPAKNLSLSLASVVCDVDPISVRAVRDGIPGLCELTQSTKYVRIAA